MLAILDKLPDEAKESYKKSKTLFLPAEYKKPKQILICGMGGSAISGDIIRIYLSQRSKIPIVVNRSPYIPNFVDENTLSILVSYSGTTKEILNCFEELKKRNSKIIIVTSGKTLGEFAEKYYFPYIKLKKGKLPRAAIGDILYGMLGVLEKIPALEIKNQDITESIKVLSSLREQIWVKNPPESNLAFQMAQALLNKTPVMFGISNLTEAVALRWKTQFNENTKLTAVTSLLPEMTHNEIVNLTNKNYPDWQIIILRDFNEIPLLTSQINITMEKLKPHVSGISELRGQGENLLARQMSLIYLGDYISVYLALLNGIDPTPINAIQNLKKMLQEKKKNV